ncbi:ROK family protein [Yinghuangia seranimata]|uniref:ROK family protein n=1 Tax=Yinghuangia seranimata TaxID=408067 RepID=UPI00248B2985|nr:ROK family protein [Yinghuangia seranimata]MDI2129488.1 ROK family protein [Yinghuangia seranimata]
MPRVIALDVGGTFIKAGVAGPDGSLHNVERWPTRAELGPEAVLEATLDRAARLAARYRPAAVGIVVPGVVDEGSGTAVLAANLGWRQVPVRKTFAERLRLPVAVSHDVRAGGVAEARVGAGRDSRAFLFVPVGTGIAAAVMVDGEPLPGTHHRAGELGHLVIRPGGPQCPCGARGCLETIASATAVARRYAEATGQSGVTAKDVAARVATGDPTAVRVWHEAVEALADGLASAIALFDPERVVIGGGLARASEAYLAPVRSAVRARLGLSTEPCIVPARLGDDAGCQGAAFLAHDLLGRAA